MKHLVIDARIRQTSTGRYMDRLLEHLQTIKSNYRYTIILNPSDNWRPTNSNFRVVTTNIKPYSFNIFDHVSYAWFLHKLHPDLVHFTITPQEPVFYFGIRVTTTHDLTMFRYAEPGKLSPVLHWLRMLGYRFIFWHSHLAAKRIIVPTQFVRQDLINRQGFTKNKIVVTLEAADPPIKTTTSPLTGVKPPFILHVGSPMPHKNIERLVEAFEALKQSHPKLQLVLAGKQEFFFDRLKKTKIDKSKFADSIITPGFIKDSQLNWLYENAECYVLPSLSEGFGLPGLEAMAHGCPLVSSNATCLPEVYGNAAHYFDPENVDDMAKKISEVLENKKLQAKLVRKGYKQLKNYSWEKMAKETLAVYEKVLEK